MNIWKENNILKYMINELDKEND